MSRVLFPQPRRPRCVPRPRQRARQRGFSMLEAALLVLLIGSAIAVGMLVLKSDQPARQAQAQEAALQWADQALVAYAAAHASLPCAVATPTSAPTDCVGPNQKGWLPVQALEAVHPTGAGPGQPLRYMVYRGGTGSDLAVASDQFSPHTWERTPHDFGDAINGLDLCASLANAARETAAALQADRARTTDINGTPVNVAYGLGVPGATAGDGGGRFDGSNQDSAAVLESPSRGADSRYDDRVRVRDFNALAQTLGCGYAAPANPDGLVLASLDMLALAADVSDEVTEQHEGNKEDTQQAVVMAGISEAFAIINVALAAAQISSSASTLATASTQLAAAIASCVVLVGCALIPPYTGAVTAGGVAVGLSAAGTALAAIALGLSTGALAVTVEARDMAMVPLSSPAADLAQITEQTCLSAEGGYRLWDVDPVTNTRFTVDPPGIYQDGLLQDVQEIETQIAEVEAELADTQANLAKFESGEMIDQLFNYDHNKPVKGKDEKDADYNARLKTWQDAQPDLIKTWKLQLAAKLEAIRKAEDAHYDWEIAAQAEADARTELEQMNKAVVELAAKVVQCDVTPPTDLPAQLACTNNRNSLAAFNANPCTSEYTSVNAQGEPQCLYENQRRLTQLENAESSAYSTYVSLTNAAVALPQPPLNNVSWWCIITATCQTLIIPYQDDDDTRETYARTYYQRKHLVESLRLKREELAEKQDAYLVAKQQCEALKAMAGGTASGEDPLPVWAGPAAILQAANCKGATGPVQPSDCSLPPPVTP